MDQTYNGFEGRKDPLHELANVVGSILFSAQSMLMVRDLPSDMREDLEAILSRSQDGKRLIDALRERP